MKNLLLVTPLLILPSFLLANDDYQSAGLGSQFIFEMDKDTVFAALLEAGTEGYGRGNLTMAAQGSEQHWFKFSGEYLIEHQDINFTVDPRQIWVDQYAAGATYQYFPSTHSPIALLANGYGSYTPSVEVNALQRIAEAIAYGGNTGIDVYLPTRTQIEALLRYDVVTYHNSFSPDDTEQGFGGSGSLKQYFGCRWNLAAGADFTAIYNNYYSAINVLFPLGTQAFQLGLRGQYNDPHEDLTRSLIGMVTFGLQPLQPCDTEAVQKRETLASFASRPAVYMPTVLAKLDEALDTLFSIFIPNTMWGSIADSYDVSVYFTHTGSGPLTYTVNTPLNPNVLFDGTTGIFTPPPFASGIDSYSTSVTATDSQGNSITSNVFTIAWSYP